MPYIEDTYHLKHTIEVEKKHTGKYGAPGQKRRKKRKATKEEIQKQNQRNAEKKLRRIINANFEPNDLHIVLTYKKDERLTPGESKKELRNFFDRVRRAYRNYSTELKYIVCTEYENKAIHHHIIINDLVKGTMTTTKIIRQAWLRGRPKFTLLDDTGDYKDLAEYIIKETSETFRKEGNPNKTRYSCSRNLIRPIPERKIVTAKTFAKDPKPKKGYYIDKNSVYEGINPVTGFRYQYYTMVRINRRI